MDEIIERALNKEYDAIYSRHHLVDLTELSMLEDELVGTKKFLPFQIRRYLKTNYLKYLQVNDGDVGIINQIIDTRNQGVKEKVSEFITWINDNKQYNQLLDEKDYQQYTNEIEKIEMEYSNLELW